MPSADHSDITRQIWRRLEPLHEGDNAMTGAQPGFERRLSAALDAAPSRIPVVLGGCGTGRTWLLQRVRERLGRSVVQYIDVERCSCRRSQPRHRFRGRAVRQA